MSLLIHPGDTEGKVVPQLHEVAGWIAGSSPEIFNRLTKADPQVLIRSDAARVDEKDRMALISALLTAAGNDQLFMEIEQTRDLHKLSHSGIAGQLRPYITARAKKDRVREFAIDVARACNVKELQADIVKIALDASEPYYLRKIATFFVSQVADADIRALLKPLTEGSADDVQEDLKGWSLRAVWPANLTTEELFQRLTPPKRENYIGGYKGFLRELEESITPDMLRIALQWAENHISNEWDIGKLIDKLLTLGFAHIEKPEVRVPYIRVALARFRATYSLLSDHTEKELSQRIAGDSVKRRLLISSLVSAANDPTDSSMALFRIYRLLSDEDLFWVIEQALTAESPELVTAYVQLLRYTFDMRNAAHVDAIIIASKTNDTIRTKFGWLVTPVELNSEQAKAMKESYEQQQRLSRREAPKPLTPPPAERLATLLQESESGKSDAFIEMSWVLTIENDHYGDDYKADVTKFLVWEKADGATRGRVLEAARRFITEGDPTWEWLGTGRITYAALAGYRAVRLLFKEDKEFLAGLPPSVWQKWVPSIVGHPFPTMDDEEDAYEYLVSMVQKHAPEEVARAIQPVLEKEDGDHKTIFVLRHFEDHWSTSLTAMILDKIKSRSLSDGGMAVVLGVLLDHDITDARALVESWLPLPLPPEATCKKRAATAAKLLVEHAHDAGWDVIWPAMQSDTDFGKTVVESTFGGIGYGRVPQLTEEQIANLYIWLVQQYPYKEDPQHDGAHFVGSRESIAHFRDGLVAYLSQRGTYAALCGA